MSPPDGPGASRPRSNGPTALAALIAAAAVLIAFWYFSDGADKKPPNEAGSRTAAVPSKLPFADIREQLGVDFVHVNGAVGEKLLPESGGSGCAWFDYDQDGDPDLLLLNGRPWPWDESTTPPPDGAISLFRNDGQSFANVTTKAGLEADLYGQGVAVGDFDADGDDDLFFTSLGPNRAYRNDGGAFVDVTEELGLSGDSSDWTTSAGFFDYDRDGDLDLFVCNYLRWTRDLDEAADVRLEGAGRSYAHPENFPGTHNYLYRNDGDQFTDVSADAGIQVVDEFTGKPLSKALAVTFVDVDRDGWLDVCVANDTVRHFLFHNNGDGTFEEVGQETGFALNSAGQLTSGMGVDAATIDDARVLALAIGNFADEMTSLYLWSPGDELALTDETIRVGVAPPPRDSLTFGLLFEDVDLDGRADLLHANGHLEETIQAKQAHLRYAQPAQLFWNAGVDGDPQFFAMPADSVGDLSMPAVGRGLASADVDNDGDVDLVLTQVGGPPLILRNDQATGHHWLRVRLQGADGNPHAIGAAIELTAGGRTQLRAIMPTRSYLSQCEPIATFGIGDAVAVEKLVVTWPDGSEQETSVGQVDQVLEIRQESASFMTLANQGKAQLENGQFAAAIELFNRALAARPDSLATLRNLVRAYVQNGQQQEALATLDRLQSIRPEATPAVAYMRGLAQLKSQQFAEAVESFQQAVRLDPDEATFHYQLAQALIQLNRTEEAKQQLEQVVQLDPLHGSANYQLSTMARKAGDQQAALEYLRNHQRILAAKGSVAAAALEACKYTDAEPPERPESPRTAASSLAPVFSRIEPHSDQPSEIAAVAVEALEDTGRYRLLAITTGGDLVALRYNEAGQLEESARPPIESADWGQEASLLVGNALVDPMVEGNDQGDQPELAIVTPQRSWLLRRSPSRGEVVDLSESSGLNAARGDAAQWVDVDHDGDIDLCVGSSEGLQIWRNNGDGSFVDATAELGAAVEIAVEDLDAADFDGTNLGVEIVTTGREGSATLRNQLAGKFQPVDDQTDPQTAAERVEVDDFNNDGLPDTAYASDGMLSLELEGTAERQRVPLELEQISAAATIDFDNDGWLDLAVSGQSAGQAKLWLIVNQQGRFDEQPAELPTAGLDTVRSMLDLDADGDGRTDLLLVGPSGRVATLKNETPTENRQLKLTLHSFAGHPSSIGVRVQVRAEDHVVTRWTDRELPIEIGMGGQDAADSVQTLWVNGVFRNELDVAITGEPLHVIVIEFVRTDSCPLLYAQQNDQWRFRTDLLGTSPLNVVVARGVLAPSDPDEVYVLGPAEQFADDSTAARLRITSELREVIYLDQLRLAAVDHPADTTVFSRDRVAVSGVGGLQFSLGRDPIPLQSAIGDDGVNRTAALTARDNHFAPPGPVLPPPSVGYTEPLSLELDFGPLPSDELLLALTGWYRFGNSSTNIAASQRRDLQVVWPTLEAQTSDGQWHEVDQMVGFPAGNTKTIICDLNGKLPASVRRLRLTTSFEVRWDQIALYRNASDPRVDVTELAPTWAELEWHGFHPLRATSPELPQTPDLDRISDRPPWQTAVEGWCTAYGPIAPLLTSADGVLAILNSGDGATIEFSAQDLPPLETGLQRTLLLYSKGWIKAGDPNCTPGLRVSPLPGEAPSVQNADSDWQRQYNTRWVPRNRFRRARP